MGKEEGQTPAKAEGCVSALLRWAAGGSRLGRTNSSIEVVHHGDLAVPIVDTL
jgi:hypothetical protein